MGWGFWAQGEDMRKARRGEDKKKKGRGLEKRWKWENLDREENSQERRTKDSGFFFFIQSSLFFHCLQPIFKEKIR